MTEPSQPIDYARPQPARRAAGLRYLLAMAGCFAVAWLVWLGIGYVGYDPVDDDSLSPWLVAVVFGTPSGAILAWIALTIIWLHSRRDGSAS